MPQQPVSKKPPPLSRGALTPILPSFPYLGVEPPIYPIRFTVTTQPDLQHFLIESEIVVDEIKIRLWALPGRLLIRRRRRSCSTYVWERSMKLDTEMEMLLNEIPLLHHGGLLGAGDAEADDLSYLIHELDDDDDEPRVMPGAGGGDDGLSCFIAASVYHPKKREEDLLVASSFSMAKHMLPSSLFDPFPSDGCCWGDARCSPPPRSSSSWWWCKSERRKNAAATSPNKKQCGGAGAAVTANNNKLKPSHGSESEGLAGLRGFMYHVARDQHGCRFLQQRLDDGKREVDLVFAGVARHAAQLMVDPFGNYLMQKLLAVCDDGQRMAIVLALTADDDDDPLLAVVLVRISLNVHGTRAVQKLIESLVTKEEIRLVIHALRPGFLDLIKDPNGNHVVQKCLQSFDADDNKPIFDAAALHCLEIGMQCHGCCVLQRCIARSRGEHREKLVVAIACNGFELAQDAYGNYVVQYVMDLKIPNANSSLARQFEGKYVHLSMQKFSSNVVEKCLKVFKEADKAKIILELLATPHLERLLQHPYANYVIYSALQNSKGSLHSALTNAIRPHVELLRTSPYCKRIYSRALLKK